MSKTYLIYHGEAPIHALKKEWGSGSVMTLDELFSLLGSKCQPPVKSPTRDFINWVYATYIEKLGPSFEFIVSKSDFEETNVEKVEEVSESVETASDEVAWEDMSDERVMVESSSLEVATSEKEAEDRLRKMRHPSVVGQIERTSDDMKTNKKDAEGIKALPKPFSSVLTGDDLNKSSEPQIGKPKTKSSAFILDQTGQSKIVTGVDPVKEAEERSQLANLSSNFRVLGQDSFNEGETVTRNMADTKEETTKGFPAKVVTGNQEGVPEKKNKYFQGFQGDVGQKEVSPEDIVRNSSEKEAIRLIGICKNSTVLKVAKIQLKDLGNHRLVEKIDTQLRKLPPGV